MVQVLTLVSLHLSTTVFSFLTCPLALLPPPPPLCHLSPGVIALWAWRCLLNDTAVSSLRLSQSGLRDTNLGEGATPFCVTGPRDGDGIIVLIRGAWIGVAATLTHPGLSPYGGRLIMSQLMCCVHQLEILSMVVVPKRWRRFYCLCPLFYFLPFAHSYTDKFTFWLQLKNRPNSLKNLMYLCV